MNLQSRVVAAVKAQTTNFESIRFVNISDNATWEIQFTPAATQGERDAANAAMLAVPYVATADDDEAECAAWLNGGGSAPDLRRVLKAKMISDLAFRLGKAPGALTSGEIAAERNRIAAIYKAI